MESTRVYKLPSSPTSLEPVSVETVDPFQTRSQSQADVKKLAVRDHFNAYAGQRTFWEQKAEAYYEDQACYFRFLVPEGLHVLEVGSGLGTLLAAVKPARGVGIDLSSEMVKEASRRHPMLEFRVGDVETLELNETFDVIILADLVGHLVDVEAAFGRLRQACKPLTLGRFRRRQGRTAVVIAQVHSVSFFFMQQPTRLSSGFPLTVHESLCSGTTAPPKARASILDDNRHSLSK